MAHALVPKRHRHRAISPLIRHGQRLNSTNLFGVQKTTTIEVGIVFSSSVTGFTAADLTMRMTRSNIEEGAGVDEGYGYAASVDEDYGVTPQVILSGQGASYTATVSVPLDTTGTMHLEIAPGAAEGVFGASRTVPVTSQNSGQILFNTKLAELVFTEPSRGHNLPPLLMSVSPSPNL